MICQNVLQPCLSENHTIIWIVSVGGEPYRSSSPTPCTAQGQLQLSQFAHISIQPDLGCFQGQGIHHLSGQSVPVPHHSSPKILFPSRLLNLSLFVILTRYRLCQLYWSLQNCLVYTVSQSHVLCVTVISLALVSYEMMLLVRPQF